MENQQTTRNDNGRAQRIYQEGQHVAENARMLSEQVRKVSREVEDVVRDRLNTRPYVTLGIAAAVGYVLGGGLPRWITRIAAEFGIRAALAAAVRRASEQSTSFEDE